jgi:hypothetical protein
MDGLEYRWDLTEESLTSLLDQVKSRIAKRPAESAVVGLSFRRQADIGWYANIDFKTVGQ